MIIIRLMQLQIICNKKQEMYKTLSDLERQAEKL